jgi:hypothetical protein
MLEESSANRGILYDYISTFSFQYVMDLFWELDPWISGESLFYPTEGRARSILITLDMSNNAMNLIAVYNTCATVLVHSSGMSLM